ncbi:MAG: hypothetical protein NT029_05995 [Armatimonadetes bacterium]|nr:hypothetical protein [Armatimonadota bacterium]
MPLVLRSGDRYVGIQNASGISEIPGLMIDSLKLLGAVSAIGVVLDADSDESVISRFVRVRGDLAAGGLALPDRPGALAPGPPRTGIYVMPDNESPGTLETILLKCGEMAYPQLFATAQTYVDSVDRSLLTGYDLREIEKPAGLAKAVVGCIGSVLRPGRSLQVTLQDNRWLEGDQLRVPAVAGFAGFLNQLLALQ